MRRLLGVTLLTFFLLGPAKTAQAEARFCLIGGLNFASFSLTPTTSTTSGSTSATTSYDRKLGHGGGVELDIRFSQSLELAAGGLYLLRTFGTSPTPIFQTQELQIPVLLRIFLDKMVSVQGGAYFSRFLGSVKIISEPTTAGAEATTYQTSYNSLNFKTQDYGLIMGMNVMTDTPSRVALDLRYTLGLNNLSSISSYTAKDSAIQVLMSITLAGGKR